MEGKPTPVEMEDRVAERLASARLGVFEKRSTVPKQYAALLSSSLKLQLEHTIKTIYLPKKDLRKPGFKYNADKSVEETFNLPTSEVAIEELPELISQLQEVTQDLFETIKMVKREP